MLQRFAALLRQLSSTEQVGYFAWGPAALHPVRTRALLGDTPVTYAEQGGGGYARLSNGVIIGGNGGGGGGISDTPGYRRVAGHGFGMMMLGYLLESTARTRFFPYVGIGGGGDGIVLSRREALRPGENVARDPRDRITDGSGGPMLHLGFTVELRLGGRFGALVGVQVGTAFPLFGRPRRYLRLLIGGGRFDKG